MTSTLYRFPAAEGLTHLLDHNNNNAPAAAPTGLQVHSVHGSLGLNGPTPAPSPFATKSLLSFDHIVCDFDETITDHDTTSSFDTIAGQIRSEQDLMDQEHKPELSWNQILQAYLDDLDKVDNSDLCHLKNNRDDTLHQPRPQHLDPRVRDLKCHTDGRKLTPEPELPIPRIPSLQPWIHAQVRKRAVEKISLDRVYDSGNLVGITKPQIRAFGREQVRLRPGMVKFLRSFVAEQDRIEQEEQKQQQQQQQNGNHHQQVDSEQEQQQPRRQRGEIWILSVNWSRDLIKGAMDQVFGSEEATSRYLPNANIISSNLQFSKECRDVLMKQRKALTSKVLEGSERRERAEAAAEAAAAKRLSTGSLSSSGCQSESEQEDGGENRLSNGKVRVKCLTGTDKLHAFQKVQRDYAAKYDLTLTDTKWAYFGDSSTDLGCLVEADVGVIIGHSKSLITECERSGVQVIDLVEQEQGREQEHGQIEIPKVEINSA